MTFTSITNFNFYEAQNFKCPFPKYSPLNYEYYRNEDDEDEIIFETNFLACPCIYYVRDKERNLFCYSFDVDNVVDFAKAHNIPLTDTYDNLNQINDNIRKHIKPSVLKNYRYSVKYIEQWKRVVLDSQGDFSITYNEFVPYQKEISENLPDFLRFLEKYKKIVDKAIDDNNFVPTLTGGLDTRGLITLYKDRITELPGFYLKAIKQDGRNNAAMGELETILATNVAKIVNLKSERFENLSDFKDSAITLSGTFNENAIEYENPADIQYITKIISHSYSNSYTYSTQILPYIDDDYLQFAIKGEFLRIFLILYGMSELRNVPFISGTFLYNQYPQGVTLYQLLEDSFEYLNSIWIIVEKLKNKKI